MPLTKREAEELRRLTADMVAARERESGFLRYCVAPATAAHGVIPDPPAGSPAAIELARLRDEQRATREALDAYVDKITKTTTSTPRRKRAAS